jgi:hypothetical protein
MKAKMYGSSLFQSTAVEGFDKIFSDHQIGVALGLADASTD